MTDKQLTPLDNPAWHALNGPHAIFAEGTARVKRYRRGILPFAAWAGGDGSGPVDGDLHAWNEWIAPGEVFFLIGELPPLPEDWSLLADLPCAQMVGPAAVAERDAAGVVGRAAGTVGGAAARKEGAAEIIALDVEDREELYQLVQKVQPGYYERDTQQLGQYYGIQQEGRLVAVAGERLHPEGLTEISAVCTDPDYTGRQYAQQLILQLCADQLAQGGRSFLHVLETNTRAIRLYEYLGFTRRRSIVFHKLIRNGKP